MMQDRHWALIKWGSLGISIGSAAVAAVILWLHPDSVVSDQPQQAGVTGEEPQTRVKKPLIVERRGDRMIWRLQARSAKQQVKGMYLVEPRLEIFTESGEAIPIRAHEAWFEPISKNILFKGAVQVNYHDWTLTGSTLRYDSERDEAVMTGKFRAEKPGVTVLGRGMRLNRKKEELLIEHDVRLEQTKAIGNMAMQQGEKHAVSDQAVYRQRENLLILMGNASVEDSSGVMRGRKLIHHLDTGMTKVEQGMEGKRARLTLEEGKPDQGVDEKAPQESVTP